MTSNQYWILDKLERKHDRKPELQLTIGAMLAADRTDRLTAKRFRELYDGLKRKQDKKLFVAYVKKVLG